jgi:hypothetical protein
VESTVDLDINSTLILYAYSKMRGRRRGGGLYAYRKTAGAGVE